MMYIVDETKFQQAVDALMKEPIRRHSWETNDPEEGYLWGDEYHVLTVNGWTKMAEECGRHDSEESMTVFSVHPWIWEGKDVFVEANLQATEESIKHFREILAGYNKQPMEDIPF